MTLLILSYLGGVLTILSPCVLPVLPFVFARADRPFRSSTLPMLLGMALTFAGVLTFAAALIFAGALTFAGAPTFAGALTFAGVIASLARATRLCGFAEDSLCGVAAAVGFAFTTSVSSLSAVGCGSAGRQRVWLVALPDGRNPALVLQSNSAARNPLS